MAWALLLGTVGTVAASPVARGDDGAFVPFLAITGRPTEAEIVRKVEVLHRDGFKSVLVYPRYGLGLEYMGEEWLCLMDTFCREVKRRGMKLWLYDEFGFPSGSCNLKVTTGPGVPSEFRLAEQGVFRNADGTFRPACAALVRFEIRWSQMMRGEYE